VTSAGLLLFRRVDDRGTVQVLLAHPGGPFWQHKDDGAWSVPKGEYDADEDPLAAARREFAEELGQPAPQGPYLPLGSVRQAGGKQVTAWAVQGDLDPASAVSMTTEIEWPPRSGRRIEIPEVDRVEWFDLQTAQAKVNAGQRPFLERLTTLLGQRPSQANSE
jgi:predicted NUDIX family NTP pyrophosphohydrolase